MKLLRPLWWLVALLPAVAAGLWVTFAARLPEPFAERRALGEMTSRWTFGEWNDLQSEPAHVVARLVHLAALHLPGATIRGVALCNALLAVLTVMCLAGLLRRSFSLVGPAQPLALGVAGLMVCSPAFGADWLHGERLGLFLAPLLLLAALSLVQGDGRPGWRGCLALALAIAAPFCHAHGMFVFVGLLPGLWRAAQRAGDGRPTAWIVACLLLGNVAAVISVHDAGGLRAGAQGLVGRCMHASFDTFVALLETTGAAWLDVLPSTKLDELVLGGASWLLPVAVWRLGERSDAARDAAAPWWGCLWFALALVVWDFDRHSPAPATGTMREVMYGAFLLPAGCLGVLSARCGRALLLVGAGALGVLAVQDWLLGIEDLRLARLRVERTEATLAMPVSIVGPLPTDALPVRGPGEMAMLQERGWAPRPDEALLATLPRAMTAPAVPERGSCDGGDASSVRGTVRSSLRHGAVQCVVVLAASGDEPPAAVGFCYPVFAERGRDVPWIVTLASPLREGTRVRAVGLSVRAAEAVPMGPRYVVRNGALETEAGS